MESLADDDAKSIRLAELNVQQALDVLRKHPTVSKAINERGLTLHGMIFDIAAGELRVLDEAKKGNGP